MQRGDKVVILTDEFEWGEFRQGAQGVIAAHDSQVWWIQVGEQQVPLFNTEFEVLDD